MMIDEELVAVPAVVGLSRDRAGERLALADLTAGFPDFQPSDEMSAGFMLGTHPPEGTLLPRGARVDLIESTGHEPTGIVPDVAGQDFGQAQGVLAREGLLAVESPRSSDLVERFLVIGTIPPAGSQLVPGAGQGVAVLVSTGPEPIEPPPPFDPILMS